MLEVSEREDSMGTDSWMAARETKQLVTSYSTPQHGSLPNLPSDGFNPKDREPDPTGLAEALKLKHYPGSTCRL